MALWMFFFIGYLQARPANLTTPSIPECYNIKKEDLSLDQIKDCVSCLMTKAMYGSTTNILALLKLHVFVLETNLENQPRIRSANKGNVLTKSDL